MGILGDLVGKAKEALEEIGETADEIIRRVREAVGPTGEPELVPVPIERPRRPDTEADEYDLNRTYFHS